MSSVPLTRSIVLDVTTEAQQYFLTITPRHTSRSRYIRSPRLLRIMRSAYHFVSGNSMRPPQNHNIPARLRPVSFVKAYPIYAWLIREAILHLVRKSYPYLMSMTHDS